MREHKTADLISLFDPVFDGRTEVNSRINARFAVLGGGLGKSCKRTGQARKWRAACRRKRNIVCTEEPAQYFRSCTAQDAMCGRVIGIAGGLSNEDHAGSATVLSFPSVSPTRIAVTGRQKLNSYFVTYPAMYPSAIATLMSASRRAVSQKSRPRNSDITIFDSATIRDVLTFADATDYSVGTKHLFVSGRAVFSNGASTNERPGRPIVSPAHRAK